VFRRTTQTHIKGCQSKSHEGTRRSLNLTSRITMRHRRIIYQSKNKNSADWTAAFNTHANTAMDRQLEFFKKKVMKWPRAPDISI